MARRRLAVGYSVHHSAQHLRPLGAAWVVAAPGLRLAGDWRLACDDEVLPSAVVADSRSLRSAPTAWTVGIDGGKLIKGVKVFAICDKHGSLLTSNWGRPTRTTARVPCRSYRGWPRSVSKAICLATAALRGCRSRRWRSRTTSMSQSRPAERETGVFLPSGIRWVVERLFAWLSRYRRLNIVFDRAPDLFAAHIWIGMISIISRRLLAQVQAH